VLLPLPFHLGRVVGVLLAPHQGLLRQVVTALADRQAGTAFPLLRLLALLLHLRTQFPLVGDGDGHFLLRLSQLLAHVLDDLNQHFLRVVYRRYPWLRQSNASCLAWDVTARERLSRDARNSE